MVENDGCFLHFVQYRGWQRYSSHDDCRGYYAGRKSPRTTRRGWGGIPRLQAWRALLSTIESSLQSYPGRKQVDSLAEVIATAGRRSCSGLQNRGSRESRPRGRGFRELLVFALRVVVEGSFGTGLRRSSAHRRLLRVCIVSKLGCPKADILHGEVVYGADSQGHEGVVLRGARGFARWAIGRQRDGAGGRQTRPGRVAAPLFQLYQALRSSARRLNRHLFS